MPRIFDNYLYTDEMKGLNRIVTMYLGHAEVLTLLCARKIFLTLLGVVIYSSIQNK